MESAEKACSKGRSQAEKIGRLKYNQQLLKKAISEIEEVKLMQRTILAGLKGLFHFGKPMIQKIACVDEVDSEILQLLYETGDIGMLPKDVATRLSSFGLKKHQVHRRIVRMNKRLEKEVGEQVAEQRGWHWALSSFAVEAYGETQTEFGKAE